MISIIQACFPVSAPDGQPPYHLRIVVVDDAGRYHGNEFWSTCAELPVDAIVTSFAALPQAWRSLDRHEFALWLRHAP